MKSPVNGAAVLPGLTIEQAQALRDLRLRPSHVQRHPVPGSPMRTILSVHDATKYGRMVRLVCGHDREIRDYDLHNKPKSARCGCCKLNYGPHGGTPEDPS
jgi:hypothetical protein